MRMSVKSIVAIASLSLLALAPNAMAQVQAGDAAPAKATAPTAVDPLLIASPASLTPEQVASLQQRLADWPQLARYRDDNAALGAPKAGEARVVFFGDSITDGWGRVPGTTFFPGKPYVNRGISGQTTAQMLLRFRQDVIDLKPAAVVILAGTNDIAGNTGLSTPAMIEDNLRSMAELAQANGIHVVLASVLPVSVTRGARACSRPARCARSMHGCAITHVTTTPCISTTATPWPTPEAAWTRGWRPMACTRRRPATR